ncbi:MAG: rod shape-determining protein MreD [Actinomycetota bacterium]|nr:rod shape-determining protein MreD [Actinomycetota bacterium]
MLSGTPIPEVLRLSLLVLVVVVVQVGIVSDVLVLGVRPDLVLLLAAAAGIAGGASVGAIVGFGGGLLLDSFLQTPFGLTALTCAIVGYAIASIEVPFAASAWWIPMLGVAGASAAGVLLFLATGLMMGQAQLASGPILAMVVVVAVVNGALSLPAIRLVRWLLGDQSRSVSTP